MRVLHRASLFALAASLIVTGGARAQATSSAATQVPVKIGYINSALLLQQAPGRAEAEAQFDREVGAYRQQLSRMNDSLTALMAAYDRDAATLDTTARAARGKAIRDREAQYQDRARGLDSTMQARQAQLVKPIMERVQGVIEAIRAEDGYSMILDVGAQASVVVAADKRLDLTDRVLARLKSQAPPTTPASGAVPQPAGVTRPKK
ncbi:MAG TPA: OmpH family outer membrane protein [Gemmatimonadaceae bacterium]|jgi:outer membrane protein|nr:OmpH family outer membrane protein [Gemmatimonadaceae bacterium]